MENTGTPKKYFAFISYSHADIGFARYLHSKLESYDITTLLESDKKQKLFPVCRDETAFASGVLTSVIEEKLDQSKKLLVICTRASANSKYVAQEVEYFLGKYGKENVIPVLAEEYDSIEEIIPPPLHSYIDDTLGIKYFGLPKDEIKEAFLKIIAGLLDIDFETVFSREKAKIVKKRIKYALLTMDAVVIAAVLAITGIRYSLIHNMGYEIDVAERLCEENLYLGMKSLMDIEKKADFWNVGEMEIQNSISKYINYGRGTTLKMMKAEKPGELTGNQAIDRGIFADENKTYLFTDNILRNVVTGEKVLEINLSRKEVSFIKKDGREVTADISEGIKDLKLEYLSGLYYSNETETCYFVLPKSNETDILFKVDFRTGEVKRLSEEISFLMTYSRRYGYFQDDGNVLKRISLSDGTIEKVADNVAMFTVSPDDKVFYFNGDNVLEGTNFDKWGHMFVSPSGDYLFIENEDTLYAFDTATMTQIYTIPIQNGNNEMSFSKGDTAVVYSRLSYKQKRYSGIFYCCFDMKTGRISETETMVVPEKTYLNSDIIVHSMAISDDSSQIAFNRDERTMILKKIGIEGEIELEHTEGICNAAFRADGEVLYSYDKSGTIRIWATGGDSIVRGEESQVVLSDAENPANLFVIEDGYILRPTKDDYEVIYQTEKSELIPTCQTKDYFILTESPGLPDNMKDAEDLGERTYLKMDKSTLEVSVFAKPENDMLYIFKCKDYEKNIIMDYFESDWPYFSLDENSFISPEETDISETQQGSETCFVVSEAAGKICLYDSDLKAYIIKDKNTDTEICRFESNDKREYMYISESIVSDGIKANMYRAIFNKEGTHIILQYIDKPSNTIKAGLISLDGGKTQTVYDGYAICPGEHWTDTILLRNGEKLAYTLHSVFLSRDDMLEVSEKLLNEIGGE